MMKKNPTSRKADQGERVVAQVGLAAHAYLVQLDPGVDQHRDHPEEPRGRLGQEVVGQADQEVVLQHDGATAAD
jgi:hypothetical protein